MLLRGDLMPKTFGRIKAIIDSRRDLSYRRVSRIRLRECDGTRET
jgi:hypothetical protein